MYNYLDYANELCNYRTTVFRKEYLPFFMERCKEWGYNVSTQETEDGHVWVTMEE
jgi:hypothetical protein